DPTMFTDVRFGVRPFEVPQAQQEPDRSAEIHREKLKGLSIKEIVARRMELWGAEKLGSSPGEEAAPPPDQQNA
ncbi:MAG TPA: hypothetical protein VEX38_07565, partial [Fimbriimonadaceae bacterium]|nr:hypothetical protein [Fimbriimonadaceae bacterium]